VSYSHNILCRLCSGAVLRAIMCTLLCVALCGGQWLAMQTVAWVGMIVAYSRQDGLATGVTKTFDGQNPCSMCQSIARAKNDERDSQHNKQRTTPTESILIAVLPASDSPMRPSPRVWPSWRDESHERLVYPPPTPPPRA
jgi:hypothetical protein